MRGGGGRTRGSGASAPEAVAQQQQPRGTRFVTRARARAVPGHVCVGAGARARAVLGHVCVGAGARARAVPGHVCVGRRTCEETRSSLRIWSIQPDLSRSVRYESSSFVAARLRGCSKARKERSEARITWIFSIEQKVSFVLAYCA